MHCQLIMKVDVIFSLNTHILLSHEQQHNKWQSQLLPYDDIFCKPMVPNKKVWLFLRLPQTGHLPGIWEFGRFLTLKLLTGLVVNYCEIPFRQMLWYRFLSQLENRLCGRSRKTTKLTAFFSSVWGPSRTTMADRPISLFVYHKCFFYFCERELFWSPFQLVTGWVFVLWVFVRNFCELSTNGTSSFSASYSRNFSLVNLTMFLSLHQIPVWFQFKVLFEGFQYWKH